MGKIAEIKESSLNTLLQHVKQTIVLPFTETPSVDKGRELISRSKIELHAEELFSLFTANIIKEDVIFTR